MPNHIIQRGLHYYYVCRVPNDIHHLFPKPTIWKSLKSSDIKHALILGTAFEYRTQQLFMQIRSGMLDRPLIDHLIAIYLQAGINQLESKAYGYPYKPGEIKTATDDQPSSNGNADFIAPSSVGGRIAVTFKTGESRFQNSEEQRIFGETIQGHIRNNIKDKTTEFFAPQIQNLIKLAKTKYNATLNASEKKMLGIRVMNAEKELYAVRGAIQDGEHSLLERLKDQVEKTRPYFGLNSVISKYKTWYLADRPDIKPGSRDDMEVECALLLEFFGNISIDIFNTMDSVTAFKQVLLKYPKNRVQRFGPPEKRSIKNILNNERGYDTINLKTANDYISRAKNIVTYALKSDLLDKSDKWTNERFKINKVEEAKRQPYDDHDINRLIDALCTQKLWSYNPPKPERFWIILIALFHGLRLSNVTGLTKKDIVLTNDDIWVFRVRFGKKQATIKDYPIHDCLLVLGFLEWVETLDRIKLFQDSSPQISSWWNRKELNKDESVRSIGFEERYITQDRTKCLYSLRHHYAGEVYNASNDYKATAEALGHSLGGKVTNGYIGKIRVITHKELIDKLKFDVDLNALEERAQELFHVNMPTAPAP